MTEITINAAGEVPLPEPMSKGNRVSKYPFADLEVGQSFDVPSDSISKEYAGVLVSRFGGKLKRVFKFGFVPNEEGAPVGVVRFWRES
jgi:hypothetical protein